MARRRRKRKRVGCGASLLALAGDPGALPARRADRLAGPGQPRLAGAGARASPSTSPTTASTPTSSCRPSAQGLDWRAAAAQVAISPRPTADAQWVAFGVGRGAGLSRNAALARHHAAGPIWSALTGGERVMHVEWVATRPTRRARSACGRRNIAGCGPRSAPISSSSRDGRPSRIDHPGYGCCDAFYRATGKANAISTCNSWAADRLRARRGQDQPVAAVRPRAGVAVSGGRSEHVAAEVGVLGDPGQLPLDERRVDHQRLAARGPRR